MMWNVLLVGVVVVTVASGVTYLWCKFSTHVLSRFALVQFSSIRPTILCKNCPEPIHGCSHLGGVPSTWEHVGGYHYCKYPFPDAPPRAEAFHR